MYVFVCPEGTIYNTETQKCSWPDATECVTYPSPRLEGKFINSIIDFRMMGTLYTAYTFLLRYLGP